MRFVLLQSHSRSESEVEALCEKYGYDATICRPFRYADLRALLHGWELLQRHTKSQNKREAITFAVDIPKPVAPSANLGLASADESTPTFLTIAP